MCNLTLASRCEKSDGTEECELLKLDGPIGLFGNASLSSFIYVSLACADDAKIYAFRTRLSLIDVFLYPLVNFQI